MPGTVDGVLTSLVGGRVGVHEWARAPAGGATDVVTVRSGGVPDGPDRSADAVVLLLALHRADDVDDAFARVRGLLRPAGTLVLVTPSVATRSLADLRWRAALRPARRGPWRHRAALDDAGWLLAAADFALVGDDRVPYALPLPTAAEARRAVDLLPAAGLWPEDLGAPDRARLADDLARRAGRHCLLPVPLRRLVARR